MSIVYPSLIESFYDENMTQRLPYELFVASIKGMNVIIKSDNPNSEINNLNANISITTCRILIDPIANEPNSNLVNSISVPIISTSFNLIPQGQINKNSLLMKTLNDPKKGIYTDQIMINSSIVNFSIFQTIIEELKSQLEIIENDKTLTEINLYSNIASCQYQMKFQGNKEAESYEFFTNQPDENQGPPSEHDTINFIPNGSYNQMIKIIRNALDLSSKKINQSKIRNPEANLNVDNTDYNFQKINKLESVYINQENETNPNLPIGQNYPDFKYMENQVNTFPGKNIIETEKINPIIPNVVDFTKKIDQIIPNYAELKTKFKPNNYFEEDKKELIQPKLAIIPENGKLLRNQEPKQIATIEEQKISQIPTFQAPDQGDKIPQANKTGLKLFEKKSDGNVKKESVSKGSQHQFPDNDAQKFKSQTYSNTNPLGKESQNFYKTSYPFSSTNPNKGFSGPPKNSVQKEVNKQKIKARKVKESTTSSNKVRMSVGENSLKKDSKLKMANMFPPSPEIRKESKEEEKKTIIEIPNREKRNTEIRKENSFQNKNALIDNRHICPRNIELTCHHKTCKHCLVNKMNLIINSPFPLLSNVTCDSCKTVIHYKILEKAHLNTFSFLTVLNAVSIESEVSDNKKKSIYQF